MRRILLILLLIVGSATIATNTPATVSTATRTVDYTGSGTSSFAVPFGWLASSHLVVVKYTGSCGSETYSTLVQDTDYTVAKTTSESGTVTTTDPVDSGYCLRISRTVPLTQTTNFRSQGTFSPSAHEDAVDKLTHAVQQIVGEVSQSEDTAAAIEAHIASADDHTMYFKLAGRAGGQTAYGDTASAGNLVLGSTAHATKGKIYFGTNTYYDEAAELLSLHDSLAVAGAQTIGDDLWVIGEIYGSASSGGNLDILSTTHATKGSIIIGGATALTVDETTGNVAIGSAPIATHELFVKTNMLVPLIDGSNSSGGDLTLSSTSHTTKGDIIFGSASAYEEDDDQLGLGTLSPAYKLHVVGDAFVSTDVTVDGTVYGGDNSGDNLQLRPNSAATDGAVTFSATTAYVAAGDQFFVGSSDPKYLAKLNVYRSGVGYGSWIHADGNNIGSIGMRMEVGTDAPGAAQNVYAVLADGNGDDICTIETTGAATIDFVCPSDARLKRNIRPSSVQALATVNAIPMRQFEWIDPDRGHDDLGMIAQEVEPVYPAMVGEWRDGTKTIRRNAAIPLLLKAVQELSARVEGLEGELAMAHERIDELETLDARVAALELGSWGVRIKEWDMGVIPGGPIGTPCQWFSYDNGKLISHDCGVTP